MNNYEVVVSVILDTVVEVTAESEKEARKIIEDQYYSGDIMGTPWLDEYYNGMEMEVVNSTEI